MNSKTYTAAGLLASAFLLQSCFTAKEYQRPKPVANIDSLYRLSDASMAADSNSIGKMAWKSLFTDPVLQKHIETGIKNNLDIRNAIQNINIAESYLKQGKAGYLPSLGLGLNWNHQEISKNSTNGLAGIRRGDQYELAANASWEADIWGKIRHNEQAAKASYLQTEAAKQAVQTQLISDIASSYFQLMAWDAQVKVTEESVQNRTKSLETIKALKEAGQVTEVAVKQTEAQLYGTQVLLADLKTRITLLENAMNALMGQNPKAIDRGSLADQQFNQAVQIGFPTVLLSNRPDVKAAEFQVMNAFELTNVAHSSLYPSLNIGLAGGLQSMTLKDWLSTNSIFANLMAGITQPIFNKRQLKTNVEVAEARREQAVIQFEGSLLNAGNEVSGALLNYQNESAKLSIRDAQVKALREAADYSDELLKHGMATYLEVLTAKDSELNAELGLIDNHYNRYNSLISLYKALGGGQ